MILRSIASFLLLSSFQTMQANIPSKEEQKWILRQFQSGLIYNDYHKIKMILECTDEQYKKQLLSHPIECKTGTFLHYTVRNNLYHISELLLEHGADVQAKNFYGQTPLHVAAQYLYHSDIFKLLIAYGAKINAQENYHKDTALHLLIKRILGRDHTFYAMLLPVITFLLESFADVKLCNREGKSIFFAAADIPLNPACIKPHVQNSFGCSCRFARIMQQLYIKKFGHDSIQYFQPRKQKKYYPKKIFAYSARRHTGHYVNYKPHMQQ